MHISDELTSNTIYHMDCLIGMPKIKDQSIDMILCDLPYGTTKNKWDSTIPLNSYILVQDKKLSFDEYQIYCYKQGIDPKQCLKTWQSHSVLGLWENYQRILKPQGVIVLTCNQPFTAKLITSNPSMFKYAWCWKKSLKTNFLNAKKQPLRNHEDILVFYKKFKTYNQQGLELGSISGGNKLTSSYNAWESKKNTQTHTNYPTSVLEIPNPNQGSLHPTQKPVQLFEYLINTYTDEGMVVLDNCMGSGTTAIACLNTNRFFIGFENDENYFNIANQRIQEHQKTQ